MWPKRKTEGHMAEREQVTGDAFLGHFLSEVVFLSISVHLPASFPPEATAKLRASPLIQDTQFSGPK